MKKQEEVKVIDDVYYCDICGEKMPDNYNPGYVSHERSKLIKGLMKLENFDAHEKCVNDTVRKAIQPFVK